MLVYEMWKNYSHTRENYISQHDKSAHMEQASIYCVCVIN